ncbi:hypothetical protein F2Q69_00013114 [Brassica cretica]|uniref:Uncharacterized protein n=1 Tax=Brassica cretica TaxID=69181 RepID=A0A8S9R7G9_BRACR|nr:hypothetical protein F2Q69_00013114 [Brassica cretica]
MHGFVSYRRSGRVRSLRNDRAAYVLGRYVATELGLSSIATRVHARSLRSDQAWLELDRYVATEPCVRSVATQRPSRVHAWSLRSDRAWLVRGPIAILELVRGRLGCVSVAFGQSPYLSLFSTANGAIRSPETKHLRWWCFISGVARRQRDVEQEREEEMMKKMDHASFVEQ